MTVDAKRLRDLADRLVASGPKASHVSASECHEISNGVHDLLDEKRGAEAEELRAGVEKLIKGAEADAIGSRTVSVFALQKLLDETDARDSLAHLESRDEKLAAMTGARDEACNRWEWYAQRFGRRPDVDEHDYPRLAEVRRVGAR